MFGMGKKVNKLDANLLKNSMATLRSFESHHISNKEEGEVAVSEVVMRVNEEFGFDELEHALLLSKVLGGFDNRFGDNNMHLSVKELQMGIDRSEAEAKEYLIKIRDFIFKA